MLCLSNTTFHSAHSLTHSKYIGSYTNPTRTFAFLLREAVCLFFLFLERTTSQGPCFLDVSLRAQIRIVKIDPFIIEGGANVVPASIVIHHLRSALVSMFPAVHWCMHIHHVMKNQTCLHLQHEEKAHTVKFVFRRVGLHIDAKSWLQYIDNNKA